MHLGSTLLSADTITLPQLKSNRQLSASPPLQSLRLSIQEWVFYFLREWTAFKDQQFVDA